ncbi:MAG: hypothetical protein GQ534_08975 [Candidatus Delongbacteria bacterium]|nr:hypothetical protein [Candidatus Delongbacteria bacterium]
MARKTINRSSVIVVSDIKDDSTRDEFRKLMLEKLSSEVRTESVYEFVYNSSKMNWNDIITKIEDIINERTDTVYLWDVAKPTGKEKYELYRTKIGK